MSWGKPAGRMAYTAVDSIVFVFFSRHVVTKSPSFSVSVQPLHGLERTTASSALLLALPSPGENRQTPCLDGSAPSCLTRCFLSLVVFLRPTVWMFLPCRRPVARLVRSRYCWLWHFIGCSSGVFSYIQGCKKDVLFLLSVAGSWASRSRRSSRRSGWCTFRTRSSGERLEWHGEWGVVQLAARVANTFFYLIQAGLGWRLLFESKPPASRKACTAVLDVPESCSCRFHPSPLPPLPLTHSPHALGLRPRYDPSAAQFGAGCRPFWPAS